LKINGKIESNFNLESKLESIKEIIYDPEGNQFLILANKFDEKLGFFVVKMNENDPN